MGKRARISAVDRDLFEDVLNPEVEEFASPKASTSALEPEEEIASEEVQPEGDGKVLDLAKLAKFNKKIDDTGSVALKRPAFRAKAEERRDLESFTFLAFPQAWARPSSSTCSANMARQTGCI